ASRTMLLTGLVIFAFLLYHLAHYTFGWIGSATVNGRTVSYFSLRDPAGRHDVYNMMIFGFKEPVVAVLFIPPHLVLLMHLSHGVQSTFQSLGINGPRWQSAIRCLGWTVAIFVVAGNIAIVVSVWAGWVQHTPLLVAS